MGDQGLHVLPGDLAEHLRETEQITAGEEALGLSDAQAGSYTHLYSDGGLAIYGAIISSVIVLLIFCKVRKVSVLAFADLGVHGLFIGQLIGRWGNFMNVEAFGSTTTLPWRMCGTSIAEYLLQSG